MNQAKENPAAATDRAAQQSANQQRKYTALALTGDNEKPRVDSRVVAGYLGIKHKNVREMIQKYADDFREHGKVPFQTEASPSGQREKFALLNEDQAYLLLTFSRNTAKVRKLKSQLVKAFSEARKAVEHRQTQYLPTYHDLHDKAAELDGGHLHLNLNRLINKAVNVESGQRRSLPVPDQSLIVVYQTIATKAMQDAADHKEAYAQAKTAILTAQRALQGPCEGVQP